MPIRIPASSRLDEPTQQLLELAVEVRRNSCVTDISRSRGAAVRASDGAAYAGALFDPGPDGPRICAEEAAVAVAVSAGKRQFSALAVVGAGPAAGDRSRGGLYFPCGLCRQLLHTVAGMSGRELAIYLTDPDLTEVHLVTSGELLPLAHPIGERGGQVQSSGP